MAVRATLVTSRARRRALEELNTYITANGENPASVSALTLLVSEVGRLADALEVIAGTAGHR